MSNVEIIFGLEKRHLLAQEVLESYASHHRVVDGFVGGVSNLVPIPFFSNATSAALITAQAPLVYKPLSRKIASIYLCKNSRENVSFHEEADIDEGQTAAQFEAFQNKLYNLQNTLFGVDFLLEISKDIMAEALVGNAIAAIPWIGMAASVAMDAMIAATMTWRVGLMTALYCCNFEEWIGTRRDTYDIAKRYVGPLSIKSDKRVDINAMFEKNDLIFAKHIDILRRDFIDLLITEGKKSQQIADEALKLEIPRYLIRGILDARQDRNEQSKC